MDLKRIISYLNHYGAFSSLSSFYEKRIADKHRFSAEKGDAYMPAEIEGAGAPPGVGADKSCILYLTHHFYPDRRGGTERFVYNMASAAIASGRRAFVLTLDFNLPLSAYKNNVGGMLYREFEYMGVPCIGIRHKKAPRGLYYKRIDREDESMRQLARFIFKDKGIDLIHAAYPQSFAPMLAEAAELGLPYIATLTDFAPLCHYANMVKKDGRFCTGSECGAACKRDCPCPLVKDSGKRYKTARDMLLGAAGVYVPSEFSRRIYMQEFPGLPVSVIPHGIADEFSFVKRQGLPKCILYVGGSAKHKGAELLLSAFSELKGEDISLSAVGIKTVREPADKRIRLLGSVSPAEMPALYKGADIVVVPSLFYESYNFAVREALACGALPVCADIGAIGEAVEDGKNGFLFKAGSKESLINALERALSFDLSLIDEQKMPTVKSEWDMYYNRAELA